MLSPERLKNWRLSHRLTQQDIADMVGVSRNYINMLENRKEKLNDNKTYKKWVEVLQNYIAK